MTDNDNHKLSDDELGAYLDGKHAVSRAFGELDKASPPRELDARILARARESVAREPVFKEAVFSRPYATAATVFLFLGITFLFLNDSSVPISPDIRSQNTEGNLRAVTVTLEQEQEVEPAALVPRREADAATVIADTLEAPRAQAAAATAGERARADNEVNAITLSQNLEDASREVQTTATQLRPPENSVIEPEAQDFSETANEGALEEITVTGSRILSPQSYRADREDWLREIARLRSEGATDSASQEEALFLESYPDTDIEAALAELPSP
jgi:hypothetical protein